jgi:hypothetical protein
LPKTPAVLPRAAAALAIAAAALPAAPAAAQVAAPTSASDPALRAPATVLAGRKTTLRGSAGPEQAGSRVDVERLDAARGWVRIASGTAGPDGTFAARWRPKVLGSAPLRLLVRGAGDATAAADEAPTARTTVMRAARATWYGPGLYGNRTACGKRLTRRLLGVAHRTLPCGTPVTIALAGRSITVPVVDRGPFTRGLVYDVTAAAARAIRMTGTATLGTLTGSSAVGATPPPAR